jgi:hypothetical protein
MPSARYNITLPVRGKLNQEKYSSVLPILRKTLLAAVSSVGIDEYPPPLLAAPVVEKFSALCMTL